MWLRFVNGGENVSQNGRFRNESFSGKQPAVAMEAACWMCLCNNGLGKQNGKKE